MPTQTPFILNGHLQQAVEGFIKAGGHNLVVRDLYQLQFDPVLSLQDLAGQWEGQITPDVLQEQEYVSWAQCISFIHPVWWTGLPAIIKGYIDRVFSYGFAYRYDKGIQKGLLHGKQAVIINTHGKSHAVYNETGMYKALSLTSDLGIYAYYGLAVKRHFFFEKADSATAETIAGWELQLQAVYRDGDYS